LAFYRKQGFGKTIPARARVPGSDPGHAQARYLLGICYFMEGDYAVTTFRAAGSGTGD